MELPPYLSRHTKLGFDSDDVAALLSSIDASQNVQSSTLPSLPAEILYHILEFVPIDHILPWRLVCRSFRDAVDGPVLFSYLQRTELIGYLGPRFEGSLVELDDRECDEPHLLRAHFERIEKTSAADAGAKWSPAYAIFHIDDQWLKHFNSANEKFQQDPQVHIPDWSRRKLGRLQLHPNIDQWGALTWCIRLDQSVLDLCVSQERLRFSIQVDLANERVMIKWNHLLFGFLKREAEMRSLLEEKCHGAFTFNHQEDCLRAVRRRWLLATLDIDNQVHRRVKWELSSLRPLFGKPRYHTVSIPMYPLERTEDEAVQILSLLRKEAAMKPQELAHLSQLAEHRSKMERNLSTVGIEFAQWKSMISGARGANFIVSRLPAMPHNPMAWSEEERIREEKRVQKWKSQEETITQLSLLLKESIEAMSLTRDGSDLL